jgi:hypothetical protein
MTTVTQLEIDQQVYDLYDEYCHGRIDRREFLKRAGALGAASLAMAQALVILGRPRGSLRPFQLGRRPPRALSNDGRISCPSALSFLPRAV